MNKTSLVYGAEAVKDKEYFAETTRKIVETRDWAEEEFKKLGFVFPKPSANFILYHIRNTMQKNSLKQ